MARASFLMRLIFRILLMRFLCSTWLKKSNELGFLLMSKVYKEISCSWRNRCLCSFMNSSSVLYWSLSSYISANLHLHKSIITDDNFLRRAFIDLYLSLIHVLLTPSTVVVVSIADVTGVRKRRILYLDLRRSVIAWDRVLNLLLLTWLFKMFLNMHSWHLGGLHQIIILKTISLVFW